MLAIIPARGGSKGVPRKNIKEIGGKPLIYYTIEAALNSKHIDRIIVSTDDEEIAEIAKSFGAEVPFLRPPEMATDTARAIDAYLYTVERLNEGIEQGIDDFVVLLPTAPLRSAQDIDNAVDIFRNNNASSVISVVQAEHPPTWYKKISDAGVLEDLFEESNNALNRQEAEMTFLPNGAIYIFNYNSLKNTKNYYNEKTYAYIMSRINSVDIDTDLDFMFAELLINQRHHPIIKSM